MRKLITLFIALFMICIGSIQAQSLLKVDDFTIVNGTANNVTLIKAADQAPKISSHLTQDSQNITVQIKVADQPQRTSSHLTRFENGQKAGFTPTLNADNTLLTLNFTRKFSEDELTKLLKYCEIELSGTAFNKLYKLINQ